MSGLSSGIGAAIAQELASRGAAVVINYLFENLEKQAREVLAGLRSTALIAVQADLSTLDGPPKLVAAAVEAYGKIDIIVDNAVARATKTLGM